MSLKRSAIPPRIMDVVLVLSLVTLLICTYSGIIPARTPGFYCNDLSIKRSYSGNTVGTVELLAGSLLGPLAFFLVVELLHMKCESRILDRDFLKRGVLRGISVWRTYMIGQLFVLTTVEVAKTIVSEPRPHFIETCKPNVTDAYCAEVPYITNYHCQSDVTSKKISDSQKSFPSGHAAVSTFAAAYMIWYIHHRVSLSGSHLLKPVIQLLWALFALVCSLTRIVDNRHHWWDVLAGAVLALFIAVIMVKQAGSRKWRESESVFSGEVSSEEVTPNGPSSANSPNASNQFSASKSRQREKRPSVKRLLSASSFTYDPEGADSAMKC